MFINNRYTIDKHGINSTKIGSCRSQDTRRKKKITTNSKPTVNAIGKIRIDEIIIDIGSKTSCSVGQRNKLVFGILKSVCAR